MNLKGNNKNTRKPSSRKKSSQSNVDESRQLECNLKHGHKTGSFIAAAEKCGNSPVVVVKSRALVALGPVQFGFTVLVYIAEIAPQNMRGGLGSVNQGCMYFNNSVESMVSCFILVQSLNLQELQRVVATAISAWLVDKEGRRLLLIIFSVNIKVLVGSIATLANWFFSLLITMTANLLLAWCIHSGVCGSMVSETKGKKLEELQALFR
ncbi:hypothetical protein Bca52824_038275 [Brassica carinata]|uniref:Uncharacterized protein n=1 Tax=Brassica carinata TaxID=52824 RepID=A0A8X7UX09_BRACI|nr:hypothetical protein Bca52824_038275 [Brassica carinata]